LLFLFLFLFLFLLLLLFLVLDLFLSRTIAFVPHEDARPRPTREKASTRDRDGARAPVVEPMVRVRVDFDPADAGHELACREEAQSMAHVALLLLLSGVGGLAPTASNNRRTEDAKDREKFEE